MFGCEENRIGRKKYILHLLSFFKKIIKYEEYKSNFTKKSKLL